MTDSKKLPASAFVKIGFMVLVPVIFAAMLIVTVHWDGTNVHVGIPKIPRRETPNEAKIVHVCLPGGHGYSSEKNRLRGRFATPGNVPMKNAVVRGMQFLESHSGSFQPKLAEDGSFDAQVYANAEIVLFFEDRDQLWAAPPYTLKTDDAEKTEYEFTIPLFPARHIAATVKDKKTGQPLPNVRFECIPLYGNDFQFGGPRRSRFYDPAYTDAQGTFRHVVSTGDYVFVIASLASDYLSTDRGTDEEREVFARKVSITDESDEPLEISFEFPKLFHGRLLNPDGSPAKKQSVVFRGYAWNNDYLGTTTDDDGYFQIHKTPEFMELQVNSPRPHDIGKDEYRLDRWFAKELVTEAAADPDKVWEFGLFDTATIRARFVDEAGAPITDFSVRTFRWNKPDDETTKVNHSWGFSPPKSEVPGEFLFPYAVPNVEYRFSGQFPGILRRTDIALTATATEGGQFLDLGDVTIAAEPPDTTPKPYVPPKRVPIRLYDSSGGVIKNYEYYELTFYPGSSTGRSTDGTRVTKGDQEKTDWSNRDCLWETLGFYDPSNRWAAKPLSRPADWDWQSKAEIRIDTEPGEMIGGLVLDEATGKPIAGMPVLLIQKVEPEDDQAPPARVNTLHWRLVTDSQGRFAACMVPGDFRIALGGAERGRWTRDVRLESGKPVDVELRIPAPFVGKVLTAAGRPAVEADVTIHRLSETITMKTDARGEFRLFRAPEEYSCITIELKRTRDAPERLIHWIEPGASKTGVELRLSDIGLHCRFVDPWGLPVKDSPQGFRVSAEFAKPVADQSKYKRVDRIFNEWSIKEGGTLYLQGFTPGVKYTIRYNEKDTGNNAVEVTPAETGNTIQLGDLTIAP